MRLKTLAGAKPLQPELAASKEASRPALTHAHLDTASSELWVTDSYGAVRFPVDLEDDDTDGPITAEALKAARKPPNRGRATSIAAGASLEVRELLGAGDDGVALEPYITLARPDAGTPLNLGAIYPDARAGFEVGLDAKLLYGLARAMGDERVRLRFSVGVDGAPAALRPLQVSPLYAGDPDKAPDAPKGLLMPIRLQS